MDLKLFNNESQIAFGTRKLKLELLNSAEISTPAVSRLEIITNKVVKFLLTELGSNYFDSTYGSKWVLITQVAKEYLPRYILTINSDIEKCIAYIKAGESSLSNTIDKLYTVKFNGLEFSTDIIGPTTEVLLNITIYTTLGNKALFTLTRT